MKKELLSVIASTALTLGLAVGQSGGAFAGELTVVQVQALLDGATPEQPADFSATI